MDSLSVRATRSLKALWVAFVMLAWSGPALAGAPDIVVPEGSDTAIYHLSTATAEPMESAGAQAPLDRVEALLQRFDELGNPRLLGDVQRLLDSLGPAARDGRFYVYRARLRQSLHQFDDAMTDLKRALKSPEWRHQALLLAFNGELVRGNYQSARRYCGQLTALRDDLYAASCRAHLDAVGGAAKAALTEIKQAMAQALLNQDSQARHWAVTTAADIAERAGDDAQAAQFWRLAMRLQPGDRYATGRLCNNLLNQDNAIDAVLALTEGRNDLDTLAVCRARALARRNSGEALADQLQLRFDEAKWRGEVLHKRTLAEYLLYVADRPAEALQVARDNWQSQREWPDRQLLLAAERASGEQP